MLLLLFVYIFGDTMSAGIGGGDRSDYIAYLVPGLLLMTIGSTTIGTAVSVSTDMTEGIIARFRTMAIHRGSVITGHVIGSVIQSVISVVLVGAVGVAIGFRSTDATAIEWLAAFGLLVLFALALTWIAVGMGMVSPNAEAASNNAMPLIFLPLISSTFVPVEQMPGWFQPIAEYQPFTPAIETLRGLLGHRIGPRPRLVPRPRHPRLLLVQGGVQPRPEVTRTMSTRADARSPVPPEGGVTRHHVGARRPRPRSRPGRPIGLRCRRRTRQARRCRRHGSCPLRSGRRRCAARRG
ncbi:hypothetical protein STANM309S_01214 [Streptomyces tanashiensis]